MPTNPGISEVVDKNGVTADIEAKRFDGTRTVQIQGDVTATQTWNGDSNTALTLNASIGAKKVTTDKINDKAVQAGQIDDGAVGLTQIAASAMTDTVSANNSKLVTSQGVNAAIAAATLNRGKDYGPLSVDEINAISETIPTGSTVYVESLGASDAKVINDGYSDGTMASFSVEVGEDLKYYRSPDNSLHGWYSTEANVKIKQPANYAGGIAVDSAQDASSGSAGIEFIQSFKQNTNGNITNIVKAQVDLVDSTSSTRTNAAATPNSVKSAYDLANTANTGLANKLDKTGDGKDVTATFTEASTRENIGTGEKLSVMFGKIKKWFSDLKALAFKDTVSDSDISGTISDNHIASASTWNGKYALPNGGIPKTDLASAVQTSLDKADTALQSHQPVDQNFSTPSSTNPVSTAAVVGYALPKISVEFNREIVSTTGKKLCIGKFPMGDSNLSIVLTDADGVGRYASIVIASQNVNLERGGTCTVSVYGDYGNDVAGRLSVKYSSGSRNFEVYYNWSGNYNRVQCHIRGTRIAGNPTDVMTLVDSIPSDDLLPIVNKSIYATRIGTYASHPNIGTPSIPVYVDTNGLVLACTDNFVNNITYVANQSGGGGNLNKTINGTITSVLTFMNDSEAVAIWADAKTAAANAS